MNFLNIKYFLAIVEEQSISSTARKLFISQQSLSEHLKKIESEIGVPLFERGSPLRLTAAGEYFYSGCKELMDVYNRTLANIESATSKRRSRITVGIATYGMPPFLPELLTRFKEAYPLYDVDIVKRLHSDVSHNMTGVDLYISYLPLDENLEHVALIDHDPYCVAFQKSLALKTYGSQWESIENQLLETEDLSLLRDMPFLILRDRQNLFARDLDSIFKEFHFTPVIAYNSENGDLNDELCLKGVGCLLAPSDYINRRFYSNENDLTAELLSYPIKVTSFRQTLAICYKKGQHLHAAERCFISEAKALFTTPSNG